MKKLVFLISLLSFACFNLYAQKDSTYVYAYLSWTPAVTKYVATIQINGEKEDILDVNGEKLSFNHLLHALNYMVQVEDWELVQVFEEVPSASSLRQNILIRKKMTIEDAAQYAKPKEPKKKK